MHKVACVPSLFETSPPCYVLALAPGAVGYPCGGSRTAAWVAYPAGVGVPVGGLGVRAEAGVGNRV